MKQSDMQKLKNTNKMVGFVVPCHTCLQKSLNSKANAAEKNNSGLPYLVQLHVYPDPIKSRIGTQSATKPIHNGTALVNKLEIGISTPIRDRQDIEIDYSVPNQKSVLSKVS